MNRNEMYRYLKSLGMYVVMIHNKDKKTYHADFRPNAELNQKECAIFTDWGWIRGCESIHLRLTGVRIYTKYDFGEIYIDYKSINKFEVVFEDE